MKKYVIVDKTSGEIYRNEIGGHNGTLPPMTQKQLEFYFRMPIKKLENFVKLYPVNEKHLCPLCNQPLQISEAQDRGYKWQCWYCDEDFYDIEAIKVDKKKNKKIK